MCFTLRTFIYKNGFGVVINSGYIFLVNASSVGILLDYITMINVSLNMWTDLAKQSTTGLLHRGLEFESVLSQLTILNKHMNCVYEKCSYILLVIYTGHNKTLICHVWQANLEPLSSNTNWHLVCRDAEGNVWVNR